MIYLQITAVFALFVWIFTDIAMYAPGEKRRIDQARRARVHTKSHHYKLGSRR
jgi:hypothetical protein